MIRTPIYIIAVAFLLSCTGSGNPGRTSLYMEPDDYSDDMLEEYEDPKIDELENEVEQLKEEIEGLHTRLDNISWEVSKAKSNLEDAMLIKMPGALEDLETNLNEIEDECEY